MIGRLIIALLACSSLMAAEPEHPAFGPHQEIRLSVTAEVADIAKLETKAVDILRKWDPTLTLAGARAKVRIDGKIDVARCLEYVVISQLDAITQAQVTAITQEDSHPVVE